MSKSSSQSEQPKERTTLAVTAEEVRKVEFREKRRGYHPQDVDSFLEKVATGLEQLQTRLEQSSNSVLMEQDIASGKSSLESSDSKELNTIQIQDPNLDDIPNDDGMLLKALVLAQRTADLTLEEARQEAARIVSEAENKAQVMLTEVESEVRRNYLEGTETLHGEVSRLTEVKISLEFEVKELRDYVTQEKQTLVDSVESTSNWLKENFLVLQDPPRVPTSIDSPESIITNPEIESVELVEAEPVETNPNETQEQP